MIIIVLIFKANTVYQGLYINFTTFNYNNQGL